MGAKEPAEQVVRNIRREHVLDITAGIVAGERHPLLAARAAVGDLSGYPWIDYGGPAPAGTAAPTDPTSLPAVLDALYAYSGKRVKTVVRADTLGLFLLETGPWLAWLPLNFLDALAATEAQAPAAQVRTIPLPGRLHRPALCRGPGAVPAARRNGARRCAGAELADAQIGEPVSVLDFLNSVNRCNSVRPLPGGGTRERDFDVTLGS